MLVHVRIYKKGIVAAHSNAVQVCDATMLHAYSKAWLM